MKPGLRRKALAFMVLSPALLDCFALLALIRNHQQKVQLDELVEVRRVVDGGEMPEEIEPLVIRIRTDATFEVAGQPVSLEEVETRFSQLSENQLILIHLAENQQQMGSVRALLLLSQVIAKHQLTARSRLVSQAERSSDETESSSTR